MIRCLSIILITSFLTLSCAGGDSVRLLIGTWVDDYTDATGTHPRYFTFTRASGGSITATLDEPSEDWYDVPVSCHIDGDSLFMSLWWGMETIKTVADAHGGTMVGFREADGIQSSFTLRRLGPDEMPAFRQPRPGAADTPYVYTSPLPADDGIPSGDLASAGIDRAPMEALVRRIIDGDIPNIHSMLVVRNGNLVFEEYFHGYDRMRTHRVHSVTKSITSALVGIAIDHGYPVGPGDAVSLFFPDYADLPWIRDSYPTTVGDLLAMMSGISWVPIESMPDKPDMVPDIIAMYKSGDCLAYLLSRQLSSPPGTGFQYNDGNSILLGRILETATGQTVPDFADRYLFGPLGIDSVQWDHAADGTTRTDGGLRLRPRDMAKIGMLYLANGIYDNRRIVPAPWVTKSVARQTPPGQEAYGFHWWLKRFIVDHHVIETYCAIGHGEQFIIVVPELDLVAVFTAGNYFRAERTPLEIMAGTVFPACMDSTPPTPVEPHLTWLDEVAGEYIIGHNETLRISNENSVLSAVDPGGRVMILTPVGDYQVISDDPPLEAVFARTMEGMVSHIELYEHGIRTAEFPRR